jgi:3-methyladenine DNA glycosylase AlkD
MNTAEELAAEVHAYCVAHQNPKNAGKWARYFKEGYDSWGLLDKNNELFTVKDREWIERYRSLGLDGFAKAGEILLASGKYEEASMALRFLKGQSEAFDSRMAARLAGYYRAGICNWGHSDVLCGEVIAPLLASGRIRLEELAGWRTSDLKYQRRAVPVSMLGLLKAKPAVEPLLEFLRPLMLDPERVVHQGLGWFLRETWKQAPKPVEAFLKEWKDQSPRLIFQYATEKMTPAQRARFRSSAPRRKPAAPARG